jgi:hypothetical protein
MSPRKKFTILAAPIVGALGIGATLLFAGPVLAATATPTPSTTAPAHTGTCPNM